MSELLLTNVNIASHLPAMAKQQPHTLAAVFPEGKDPQGRIRYTHYTYQQLDQISDELARGLALSGIGKGVRTVLMVKPSLDFFALVFALFKVGAVMVAVDPGMGIRNLGKCLNEARPQAFIGISKAHLARKLLGWSKKTIRQCVMVGKQSNTMLDLNQLRQLGKQNERSNQNKMGRNVIDTKTTQAKEIQINAAQTSETQADDLAAILFTSGSTGIPKGVVYTHGHFDAQVKSLKTIYHIQPGEIDLATFPLFALYAPALGMTAIIPDMDFTKPGKVNPVHIQQAIENFGVTNMFGSPALLNQVSLWAQNKGVKFPTLKRILSAGAPVSATVLKRTSEMLTGDACIFTPYGATESLPVASISSDEILSQTALQTEQGQGVCVGKPVANMVVRIIGINDESISDWSEDLLCPTGEIGEIVVRGPVVTYEYFNRPSSTKLAKIRDVDGQLCHRMGDLGYFDSQGRLWFCGRKTQRVITEQTTYYTICCEGVFNAHPQVFRTALVAVKIKGQATPVICVELESGTAKSLQTTITKQLQILAQKFEHTRTIKHFVFHSSFPVDIRHNAKIGREKLARWAQGVLS